MGVVILLTPDDLTWPLGVQDTSPQYLCGGGSYPRGLKVDPYPCYAHDVQRTESILQHCTEAFPLKVAKFSLTLLSHDFIDRVNGITYEDYFYRRPDGTDWEDMIPHWDGGGESRKFYGQAITIVLSGKRIPIMPSMTRYLVSHEYGHAVFDYVARTKGYKDSERYKLEQYYMELRGITDYAKTYNGGQWHRSPGEIIANDFRVLFTKQELEFYPHDCPLPSWSQPEGRWWREAAEQCGVTTA